MAYDAFWSFSLDDEETRQKARSLSIALLKRYEPKRERGNRSPFYVCELQNYVDDWRRNIAEAVKAPVLIVLIDETYFSKPYCFFEWLAYQHIWSQRRARAGEAGEGVGVHTSLNVSGKSVSDIGPFDCDALFAALGARFNAASNEADADLWRSTFDKEYDWATEAGTKAIRAKINSWRKDVTRTQVLDVDEVDFGDSETAIRLVRDVQNARAKANKLVFMLEAFDPALLPRLRSAARLSLLCMAFDRFHDGGWGFSLQDDYSIDDDRHVLVAGADEVNLLAMRSLRHLIDDKGYVKELAALAERLEGDSRANLDVTDRKQRLASGLLRLIGSNPHVIGHYAVDIVDEAMSEDALRWIVDRPANDDTTVFLYALCQKVIELAKDDGGPWEVLRKHLANLPRPFRTKEEFQTYLEAKQDERLRKLAPVFTDATSLTALFTNFGTVPMSRDSLRFTLQMALLMSDREFAARYCGTMASAVRRLNAADAVRMGSSELALACLILSDLLYHGRAVSAALSDEALKDDLQRVGDRFASLWGELQKRLSGDDMLTEVAKLNSVGWASFLLLCEKQGVNKGLTNPQRQRRTEDWKTGLAIRKSIGETVALADQTTDVRSQLMSDITQRISRLSVGEAKVFGAINEAEWREFAHTLARGILVPETVSTTTAMPPVDGPRPAHVGMLEVERVEVPAGDGGGTVLRVRSADDGYSKLFLAPFSERTTLRADNLSRMMRHFGGSDEELVRNISKIVVQKCYLVQSDALVPVDFEQRTRDIVEKRLRETGGAAEQDILELHGVGGQETVFVRRHATLFAEIDAKGHARMFYRWIFSDITVEWKLADYPRYIEAPLSTPPAAAALKKPA